MPPIKKGTTIRCGRCEGTDVVENCGQMSRPNCKGTYVYVCRRCVNDIKLRMQAAPLSDPDKHMLYTVEELCGL